MICDRKGLELQKRDIEILKFVFSFRVVTLSQVARRFFTERHETIAGRRIRKLVHYGFLKNCAVVRGAKMEKCIFPGEKTSKAVEHLWRFHIDKPYTKSESPEHDIRLAELGMKLEGLAGFHMLLPENLLQSSSDLASDPILKDIVSVQADGALAIKKAQGKGQDVFAVEMELTPKHITRYKDKLASYYLARGIEGVLYICGTQEIMNCLTEADKAVRGKRRSILHLVLEKNALKPREKITFQNEETQTLVLS